MLSSVTGAKIEFECSVNCLPALSCSQTNMSERESGVIKSEVQKLLSKQLISHCDYIPGEVVSPVFTRQTKHGSHCMILNLKPVNEQETYHHFKMSTLTTALRLIRKNCYMSSLDLKDAYYSVPIHKDHRKLLRFKWEGQTFEFQALPNGLSLAPRLFTKLLKPVFATLRKKGHISTSFLDDSLLLGDSKWECMTNTRDTLLMFRNLGFVVHPTKSVFEPSTKIQYLGVIIDFVATTVTLTPDMVKSLKSGCQTWLHKKNGSQ